MNSISTAAPTGGPRQPTAPTPAAPQTARDARTPAGGGWAGTLTTEPGVMAYTGVIGAAHAHAHAAVQVLHLHDGHVILRDATGATRAATRAIIPAGARHEIVTTTAATGVMTFLDPTSAAGHAAATALQRTGGELSDVDTWLAAADPTGAATSTDGHTPTQRHQHPALVQALTAAPNLIGGPMTLTDLAGRVGISPSRLGHLFAGQLGLSFPTWRRWTRLQHALRQVSAGASLTVAAHAAGFADSAHLTRTCRAMFGLTPTEALQAIGWDNQPRP
ncbi:helix-turn-helix transcriptional regulator [Micromonospora sp. RV43]|nr:AraC family transcriptional regulator [Micromonospora sp. RV43]